MPFCFSPLPAAAADGDFDFLGGAKKLAAGFHDRDYVARLLHLDPIGHARHGSCRNLVGCPQCGRVCADEERDRGHVVERRRYRNRTHRAVLGDFRCIELDLVGGFRGLAVERLDRIRIALLLEGVFGILVVGGGKRRRRAERNMAEAEQRDQARALQEKAARCRKAVVCDHLKISKKAHRRKLIVIRLSRQRVCRKSTTALISCSVKIRFRPNGGITVKGLRLVSSVTMATRSLRSGYLLLMSFSGGPIVPGRSPPLISWQVRQLPLPRSNAIFCPSVADCAQAGAVETTAPTSNARIRAGMEGVVIKGVSRTFFR